MKEETQKAEFIPIRLEALSPVHVGAGKDNALTPLTYQIAQEENGYWLYTLDVDAWLANHPNPIEVAKQIEASSQTKVWELFRREIPKEAFTLSKSKVSKDIYESYLGRLSSGDSRNELAPATRNPLTQAMLVPGSSIKGAIRTAIVQSKDKGELKNATLSGEKKAYDDVLIRYFGDISENAFQALKVSDFELLPNASEFVKPVEKNIKPNKPAAKQKDVCEVLPAHSAPLYGRLILGRTASTPEKPRHPLEQWTFENLSLCCNAYYLPRLKEENEKFYALLHFLETKKYMEKLCAELAKPENQNSIVLRVGHYSHIECVSVKDNAPQTRKLPNGNGFFPVGKTRTLANGIAPFGWVLLHKVTLEEYQEGMHAQEVARQAIVKEQQAKRAYFIAQAGEQEKAQKEAKKREEARKLQEAQEEENRKKVEAELAAMPEIVRLCIQILGLPLEKEAEVNEYYKTKLNTLQEEEKIQLAEALKQWYAKHKKWEGKQSPKQAEKVANLKRILGEK